MIERGCVLMRMSQKTGLYHITAFLKFCKKIVAADEEKNCVFYWKKFGLLSFFFLLLSFGSKMRMIEVFVF